MKAIGDPPRTRPGRGHRRCHSLTRQRVARASDGKIRAPECQPVQKALRTQGKGNGEGCL